MIDLSDSFGVLKCPQGIMIMLNGKWFGPFEDHHIKTLIKFMEKGIC